MGCCMSMCIVHRPLHQKAPASLNMYHLATSAHGNAREKESDLVPSWLSQPNYALCPHNIKHFAIPMTLIHAFPSFSIFPSFQIPQLIVLYLILISIHEQGSSSFFFFLFSSFFLAGYKKVCNAIMCHAMRHWLTVQGLPTSISSDQTVILIILNIWMWMCHY